jgi:hypothetical protein
LHAFSIHAQVHFTERAQLVDDAHAQRLETVRAPRFELIVYPVQRLLEIWLAL